uniref:Uncharacterized protein n=1 Tax=Sciurus vulgaris TaxID=55149 RepID=A0A8D2ASV6_SCIVU
MHPLVFSASEPAEAEGRKQSNLKFLVCIQCLVVLFFSQNRATFLGGVDKFSLCLSTFLDPVGSSDLVTHPHPSQLPSSPARGTGFTLKSQIPLVSICRCVLFNNGMTTLSHVIVKVLLHCGATIAVVVLELEMHPLLHLMPHRPMGWQSQCGAGKNTVFPRSQRIWPSLYKASEGPESSAKLHKVWLQRCPGERLGH